ncbi:MAG TPA: S8/S53 family peptidase [Roseiflexaceae bacterium]|nr:S8/S53 family peptidase [Roseiflexaceae bacterium]
MQQWIAERPTDSIDLIMINFRDDLQLPRFPEPVDESHDPEGYQSALRVAEELIQQIKGRRAENYARLTQELAENYRAEVMETFWLINAVLVAIPLGTLTNLAERDDVQYIEPRDSGEEPPQNTDPADDLEDGRAQLASDPLFSLGLTSGRIGLLDTGVRSSHTVFNQPSRIGLLLDCVNGGPNCTGGPGFNPLDDCWDHGTSSAAIVTANDKQGPAFRGVTGVMLDSFKVYPSGCGLLNVAAVVRGFQAAVAALDKVIVAEIQSAGGFLSAISSAADNAFTTGAVIIAANGNAGPAARTVKAPANAHNVIGVGDIDVKTQQQMPRQSRGPTSDGRFKPDIQAPTNTETASNASDTAFRVFEGTSGSTPYAAGAAALLRNWLQLHSTSPVVDPGQVYALLILSGQNPYPFDNTSGAGPLRLSIDGETSSGKVSVGHGLTIDIPLNISGTSPNTLDGALWWPESATQPHNDIDLYLIDPSGAEQAKSADDTSVFERARVAGAIAPGLWTLRIHGFDVPGGTQTVYWAAHVFLT